MSSDYAQKLKDPRWQKKRLEILERDNWTCQLCGDKKSTLFVHHRDYLRDREPWDYPGDLLVTLCEYCHVEQMERSGLEQLLISHLRKKFYSNDLSILEDAFNLLPQSKEPSDSWMIAETIRWFLSMPEITKELTDKCWEYMQRDSHAQR